MSLENMQTVIPPERLPLASAASFVDAMSTFATGVVLVTSWIDGRPWGMTVSAFASASTRPPTILVSLCTASATARAIAAEERFGVSILEQSQVAVARWGSAPGEAKFIERFVDPEDDWSELPMVADALAHLDCDLSDRLEVADHTVFVGRVRDVRIGTDGEPLVYVRRGYRTPGLGDEHRRNGGAHAL